MADFLLKKYSRKYLSSQASSLEPLDPHYETYLDPTTGKTRSRKRALPTGLSKKDLNILKSVRRRAHYLDKGFSVCGFRFGWSAVFGLIPVAGDIVAFLLSYFLVLRKCREADLPLILQERMAFNSAVSVGAGMIPLVGDIILAIWKANSRNAALLEEFLIARALQTSSSGTATTAGEAAARIALEAPGIDRAGERVGTSASTTVVVEGGMDSGVKVVGGEGKKGKRFYGWGKGEGTSNLKEGEGEMSGGASGSSGLPPVVHKK